MAVMVEPVVHKGPMEEPAMMEIPELRQMTETVEVQVEQHLLVEPCMFKVRLI